MTSVTDMLPFCDNSNICQLIVMVYAIIAMFVTVFLVVVVVGGIAWLYGGLTDAKSRDWVDLYYDLTDSKE